MALEQQAFALFVALLASLHAAAQSPAPSTTGSSPAAPTAASATAGDDMAANNQAIKDFLKRGGTLAYTFTDKMAGGRSSTLYLRYSGSDEDYMRGDGIRLRNLSEYVNSSRLAFSPPIPLFRIPMAVGQSWKYDGTVSSLRDSVSVPVESEFKVERLTRVSTPVGDFDAYEVSETRRYPSTEYRGLRYIDAKRGILLREVFKAVSGGTGTPGFGTELRVGRDDHELVLATFPGP
jgi:hypothetical protein